MGFFDDVKEDQTLQIQVLCVAFFLIAFPSYFMIKASATDNPTGMGGVGTYTVGGELDYILFYESEETIADGTPFVLDLNTDLIEGIEGKNIVGILVSMSYGEDEQPRGPPCASGTAADTITGTASHLNFSNSADGQNTDGSGSHDVITEWYNSSMFGTEVEGLSESEIIDQIDSKGAGLGDYSIEIAVAAEGDSCAASAINPLPDNEDNGETVTFTVELIVFDYSVKPYVDEEPIDV